MSRLVLILSIGLALNLFIAGWLFIPLLDTAHNPFETADDSAAVKVFSDQSPSANPAQHGFASGPKSAEPVDQEVHALLAQYCHSCHSPEAEELKGDFDMTALYGKPEESFAEHREHWVLVHELIDFQEMPPRDPQPTDAQRLAMLEWIEKGLAATDLAGLDFAGRVTVPRLNAIEYANTLNDLLGWEGAIDPATLGVDTVGVTGFSTDRDGLFLSTRDLEQYLDVADQVLGQYLMTPEPVQHRFRVRDMSFTFEAKVDPPVGGPDGVLFKNNRQVGAGSIEVATSGWYLIDVRAWGYWPQDNANVPTFILDLNDLSFEVKALAHPQSPGTYRITHWLDAGPYTVRIQPGYARASAAERQAPASLPQGRISQDEARRLRNCQTAVSDIALTGPVYAEDIDTRLWPGDVIPVGDATAKGPPARPDASHIYAELRPNDADADAVISRFTQRAFRRPLEPREYQPYVELYRAVRGQGGDHAEAMRAALSAVLVSPDFLFRIERFAPSAADDDTDRQLDHYAIASRLSYFLWMSMPDETLMDLARQGRLHDPEVLAQQVDRMLADSKAAVFTATFARQWLKLEELGQAITPDPEIFPQFTDAILADSITEVERFIDHVIRQDMPIDHVIDSDYTFMNNRLAAYYGLSGVDGEVFERIDLPNDQRGGVLGMAAVLTATSNPNRTSPVNRGVWVLEILLGRHLPEPPDDVPALSDSAGTQAATMSLREEFELHRENITCAACHDKIDPIGFGLENYDAIGRWRQRDGRNQIDAGGVLPDGTRFEGPAELRQAILKRKPDFARNVTQQMLAFALGRELQYFDQPTVDRLYQDFEDSGFSPHALIRSIVRSKPFLYQSHRKEPLDDEE